ncbi:MAG: hypothetical protein ACXWHB_00620 [Usitatibacter sp.]
MTREPQAAPDNATAAGEAILDRALTGARDAWGPRLVAAYALGSLAHGGFSPHVSDVDFGVVLADPLEAGDADKADAVVVRVKASGAPLADRLSMFWGSPATLAGRAQGGRFPPVDLLDLKEHGRLLAGNDVRDAVRIPSSSELIVAAARHALVRLASDPCVAQCRDPGSLVSAGTRALTKRVLFPVRFLYTARTGSIGLNDTAVAHFVAREKGPAADLAAAALRWRDDPFEPGDASVRDMAVRGLMPITLMFVNEYEERLRTLGESELADEFAQWRERLER